MVAPAGYGAGADRDRLRRSDDGAELAAIGGGACYRPASNRRGAHGGRSGWRSRTAGYWLERRSRRFANRSLSGYAWFAGVATAGVVDRTSPRARWRTQ